MYMSVYKTKHQMCVHIVVISVKLLQMLLAEGTEQKGGERGRVTPIWIRIR